MKKFLLIAAAVVMGANVHAQISTGEVSSHVIRTGNRAQAGNFGIYVGGALDISNYLDDAEVNYKTLPLLNFKYMLDDQKEIRLGFEWWNNSSKDDVDGTIEKSHDGQFGLTPGYAFHFNNQNLLDVYAGAELPFAFGSNKSELDGKVVKSNFNRIGVGAFIGLQAYIANLPLALGLEYGISINHAAVKDGTITEDNRTIEGYEEDLKQSRNVIGNQVRLTLAYYFDL